ncbi:hypothetical protein ACTL32_05885 [Planococcus sp. FY231025]|uniref:hypothetical protein n=1 Tax=Planococcus sp. FY231025 TaxID=3455699 RepID=UPI003F9049B0
MFRIEETEMHEHMQAIKQQVEKGRMKSEVWRAKTETSPPYWIVLLTFLHLRK